MVSAMRPQGLGLGSRLPISELNQLFWRDEVSLCIEACGLILTEDSRVQTSCWLPTRPCTAREPHIPALDSREVARISSFALICVH